MRYNFKGKSVKTGEWVYGSHIYLKSDKKNYIITQELDYSNMSFSNLTEEDPEIYVKYHEVYPDSIKQYTLEFI